MNSKFFRINGTWIWICILIVLMVVVNVLLYHYVYLRSSEENKELWLFFQSEVFKAFTIAVIVAIIGLLAERVFKIKETFEERIRSEKQKRIDNQWECIKKTSEMWDELYSLTTEVRHFKYDKKRREGIIEIIQKLENYAGCGKNIIDTWQYSFPELYQKKIVPREKPRKDTISQIQKQEKNITDTFMVFISMLYNASTSTAYFMLEALETNDSEEEPLEVKKLRNTLGVIQDCAELIAHHTILEVLSLYVELSRYDISVEQSTTRKQRIMDKAEIINKINNNLENLTIWAADIKAIEKKFNKPFPSINESVEDRVKDFRAAVKEYNSCVDKTRDNNELLEAYQKCFEVFSKIPFEQFVNAWEIDYSKEYMENLASWLGFEYTRQQINETEEWQSIPSIFGDIYSDNQGTT